MDAIGHMNAPSLSRATEHGTSDKASKTAERFEATFLTQVFTQMLETVELGEHSGGHAEEQWRSMMAGAMAESVSKNGGVGISRVVIDEIQARIEEGRQP